MVWCVGFLTRVFRTELRSSMLLGAPMDHARSPLRVEGSTDALLTCIAPRAGLPPLPRATDGVIKDDAAHQQLTTVSGYSGTVELTLPSQKSAHVGRFRRFL